VDEIMDDLQEEKDVMDQISDAISRPAQDLFDDVSTNLQPLATLFHDARDDAIQDELLQELNELEEQELESALLDVPAAPVIAPARRTPGVVLPDLPEAPTSAVHGVADDDEAKALRDLEASMALML
jgi:hypothetical protein